MVWVEFAPDSARRIGRRPHLEIRPFSVRSRKHLPSRGLSDLRNGSSGYSEWHELLLKSKMFRIPHHWRTEEEFPSMR